MNGKIDLCIVTYDCVYKIPFTSIKQLDLFTVRYNNDFELCNSLIRILELPINIEDVMDLDIQYVYSDTKLPIKYSKNNYDTESVIDGYVYYLQCDHNRLSGYGIRNFMERIEPGYRNLNYSDSYIGILGRRYLKDDYRKIRDAYFLIKDEVYVRINDIESRKKYEEKEEILEGEEDYIDYLLSCLEKDEEHYFMAMEELACMDLEVLESRLGKSFGKIDGIRDNNYNQCDLDDIKCLVKLTGISHDDLKIMVKNKDSSKRRR